MNGTAARAPTLKLIDQLQLAVPAALAMLAGLKLDLFSCLADGPREADEIAKALGVDPSRLSRLLFALAAAGILERRETGFANGDEAATYFVSGSPRYVGGMHEISSNYGAPTSRRPARSGPASPPPCTTTARRPTTKCPRCCAACTRSL